MNISALLEIVNDLRKQMEDIQRQVDEQQTQEKNLIEQKYQEEIESYQSIISQQKDELERLTNDNLKKKETIVYLQKSLNEKDY